LTNLRGRSSSTCELLWSTCGPIIDLRETRWYAQLGGFSAWRELGLLHPKFPVSVYCFATKAQLLHVFDGPQRCPQSPPLFPVRGKSKDCWKPEINDYRLKPVELGSD
jgi:hypothetical protein